MGGGGEVITVSACLECNGHPGEGGMGGSGGHLSLMVSMPMPRNRASASGPRAMEVLMGAQGNGGLDGGPGQWRS